MKITANDSKEKTIKFPKLMKSLTTDLIILATGDGKSVSYRTISGVIVKCSESSISYFVGKYSTTWSLDNFQDYDGEITMSND